MKVLAKLEKNKACWYLLLIVVVFFLLRLPSLIEPDWYGDEGVYQVIGQALHNGRLLYTEVWDNKPPLLYVTYAIFNGDQFLVRFVSLFFGIGTLIAFFLLTQKLFNNTRTSITASALFTFLFATPFLEGNIANAENFILLPISVAALLIYKLSLKQERKESRIKNLPAGRQDRQGQKSWIFFIGLLLGLAFLFKIVATFDFVAFLLFFILVQFPKNAQMSSIKIFLSKTRPLILDSLFMILGFLLPLEITFLYFISHNALTDFISAAFSGNIGYVGYGNTFLHIPQGLLLIKSVLLITIVVLLFLKRNRLSKPALFILLWSSFSLFSVFFSQRPYAHYLIMLIPSFCLLVGLFISQSSQKMKLQLGILIAVILLLVSRNYNFFSAAKTPTYYQNMILFLTGQKTVTAYQSFFDTKTPRDYDLVAYINKHTTSRDTIFLWGDSAQIYAMAHKLPPNRYTVAYHITQNKNGIADTQAAIDKVRPKYIITLTEAPPIPFHLPAYTGRYGITGAAIYERNF